MKAPQSEYERYIRTEELLQLQKAPAERVNHDELLFQVTHQVSELWMKAVRADMAEAARLLRLATVEGPVADQAPPRDAATTELYPYLPRATHLLERAAATLRNQALQIAILKEMHPVDYHQIRLVLGRGSGQDSPGFHGIGQESTGLWASFQGLMAASGVAPLDLLQEPGKRYDLYQLMQAMMAVDEGFGGFRHSHMTLVRRVIGLDVVGTGGTNVRNLEHGARAMLFKELWDAVSALTRGYNQPYADETGRS